MLKHNNEQYFINITSNKWQFIITNKNGSTAHRLIQIFSRIVYHFRRKKQTPQTDNNSTTSSPNTIDELFQTSLESLAKQYNCSTSTINRSLARLEKMAYIKRHHKHIKSKKGQWLCNVLFIELTSLGYELLNMVLPHNNKCSSCKKISNVSLQIFTDVLLEEDKIKDIDLGKSVVLKKCNDVVEEKKGCNNNTQINETSVEKTQQKGIKQNSCTTDPKVTSNPAPYKKPYQPQAIQKTFVEHLPITEQEAAHLKAQTGRDFTVKYLNDLVRELQTQNSELRARYRKGMFAYLKLSVTGEKREDHNIKDGKYMFKYSKAMEKRFSEVENSQRTTMDALMQKRVIALFEPYRAFSILEGCTFLREVWVSKSNTERSYGIYFRSNMILTQSEQDILEKAVVEYTIYVDELTSELKSAKVLFLEHNNNRDNNKRSVKRAISSIQSNLIQSTQSTKIQAGKASGDITNAEKSTEYAEDGEQSQSEDSLASSMADVTFDPLLGIYVDSNGLTFVQRDIHPIWREVRKELLKRYKLAVDRSWFSQISFSYDEANKTAMLHYESRFRQRMAGEQYGDAMYCAIAQVLIGVESIKSCAIDGMSVSGTYTENVWWRSTHKPMYS